MAKPLRVLLIEDSESDAELVVRSLRRGGIELVFSRVEDAAGLSTALAGERFDVVVCDYALPRFSAPAAMEVVKRSGLDIPFIVVSGTMSEEIAVALMKAGAQDYLSKSNLARLAPAVSREVAEAETRRHGMEARRELERQQRFAQTVLDNLSEGVVVCDADGKLVMLNGVSRQWHGLDTLGAPIGQWAEKYSLFAADGKTPLATHQVPLARALAGEKVADVQLCIRVPGQAPRMVEASAGPFHDAQGKLLGAVAVMRDVTRRVDDEAKLRSAMAEAEAASQAKGRFLARMSHELRTPLAGVIGMTGLVLESDLSSEQREKLEVARSSGQALLAIVDDVLDFALVEAGKLKLQSQPFSIRSIACQAARFLEISARQKGLNLTCNVANDVPEVLVGDPNRLRQVIVNLVGNAVKFTHKGEVALRVELDESVPAAADRGEVMLRLSVSDTGIGMDAKTLGSLFGAFVQGDATIHSRFGGVGLGLAISRELVSRMGGTIWAESTPGVGTTFLFTASLGRASSSSALRAGPTYGRPPLARDTIRLLVAEDNAVNRMVIVAILQKLGYKVDTVENGLEAAKSAAATAYDMILMDVEMPELDGIEAMRRIRREAGSASQVPIVAVTAHAIAGDAERLIHAGMDDYVSKPVSPDVLDEVILRHVRSCR